METVGFIFILLGGLNLAWFLLWFFMALIGRGSIAVSRKIGTDNQYTDNAEGVARGLGKAAIRKAVISAVLMGIGFVLSVVGGR